MRRGIWLWAALLLLACDAGSESALDLRSLDGSEGDFQSIQKMDAASDLGGAPDQGAPDQGAPDLGVPFDMTSDAGPDEGSEPDSGPDEGSEPDAGPDEGSEPDSGPDEGSMPDEGPMPDAEPDEGPSQDLIPLQDLIAQDLLPLDLDLPPDEGQPLDAAPIRLLSLNIEPQEINLIVGQVILLQAWANYSDGVQEEVSAQVDWRSSNSGVAALGGIEAEGIALVALEAGEARITARLGEISALPVTASVEAVQVLSLEIQPEEFVLPVGQSVDFRAWAHFNDGSRAEVSEQASWSSSNPLVGTLEGRRLSAHAEGETRITARFNERVSLPAVVSVTTAELLELRITPESAEIPVGLRSQFSAEGIFSDGDRRDLTGGVEWLWDAPELASLESPGELLAHAEGRGLLRAQQGEIISAPARLEILSAVPISLRLTGPEQLAAGEQAPFQAFARFSDGREEEVSERVEWQSSAPTIAQVQGGSVEGLSSGEALISARWEGLEAEALLIEVGGALLLSLEAEPESLELSAGAQQQLRVWAHYGDGSRVEVTQSTEWQSAREDVAQVEAGLVEGRSAGETEINLSFGGLGLQIPISVSAPELLSIQLSSESAEISLGESLQINALGHYADGSERDLSRQVSWLSLDEERGVFSPEVPGLLLSRAPGALEVQAEREGIQSESLPLLVNEAELISLSLSPEATAIILGDLFELELRAHFSDGSEGSAPEGVAWFSTDETVAVVRRGVVEAIALGEAEIFAELAGLSASSLITVVPLPNQAPEVQLSCPESGREGDALEFSGAESLDLDGEISAFLWSMGDDSQLIHTGTRENLSYTYERSGTFEVALTVVDDEEAEATALCQVQILGAQAPQLRFIRPQGERSTTQGESISVLVDARPGPNRNIERVSLLLDGEEVALDLELPYEMSFEIPMEAATGADLQLRAQAEDDRAELGLSEPILLHVENALPIAEFVAVPFDIRWLRLDASGVQDDTTANEALEVRWDFEDDGIWDTAFNTEKLITHEYAEEGDYSIRMQVRDNIGQLSEIRREVSFQDQRVVFGEIESQVWFGTVIVTGDVILPSEQILTIAEGTRVLFAHVDQDGDEVGDLSLRVQGQLIVEGSVNAPVIFSAYGEEGWPGAWAQISTEAEGRLEISHARIEYANIGLKLQGASCTLEEVKVQDSLSTGVYISGAQESSFRDLQILRAGEQGLRISGTGAQFNTLRIQESAEQGFYCFRGEPEIEELFVSGGESHALELIDCQTQIQRGTLNDNQGDGLRALGGNLGVVELLSSFNERGVSLRRDVQADLRHCDLRENRAEGLEIIALGDLQPRVTAQRNNIHSNATEGSHRYEIVAGGLPSVTDNNSGSSSQYSSTWHAPEGALIHSLDYQFVRGSRGDGAVLDQGGNILASRNSNFSGSLDLSTREVTAIRTQANNRSCCTGTSMSIHKVILYFPAEGHQVVLGHEGESSDLRENYFGVYPEVLEAISFMRPNNLNLQGFVGRPFDESWETGPYFGGRELEGITEWSGIIYVSGDVTIPEGSTLNIHPGTQILVAPIDQEGDELGDYMIRVDGAANLEGSLEEPLIFRADREEGAQSLWYGLDLRGAQNQLRHALIQDAYTGLSLRADQAQAQDLQLSGNRQGILVGSGEPELERISVRGGTFGIQFSAGARLSVATIEGHSGWGIYMEDNVEILDTLISENGGLGVDIRGENNRMDYCEISHNGDQGLQLLGAAGLEMDHSVVSYNAGSGFWLRSSQDNHPQARINDCNILGNAAGEAPLAKAAHLIDPGGSLRVTDNNSGSSSQYSSYYALEHPAYEVYAQFIRGSRGEGDIWDPEGTVTSTWSTNSEGWVSLGRSASRLRVRANNRSCCTGTSMIVHSLRCLEEGLAGLEMSAGIYATDRVNAQGNYWGLFPDVSAHIREVQIHSLDFSGFQPMPLRDIGPREAP